MNLKSIIRNNTADVNEMLFVAQEYIKIRKNEDVQINLTKDIHQDDPWTQFKLISEIHKLQRAYNFARNWLLQNNY